MSAKVLITGASGFIGKALISVLLEADYIVYALTSRPTEIAKRPNLKVIILESYSVQALESTSKNIPEDIQCIINLAAYGLLKQQKCSETFFQSNVIFAQALLELANKLPYCGFISAGSVSEYATVEGHVLIKEQFPITEHMYGASKASFCQWAVAYCKNNKIPFMHLRFFNVYGEGEAEYRLLPFLLNKLSKGETVDLTDGEQIRDFVHIDDAVLAIMASIQKIKHSEVVSVFNVCTSIGTSVKSLILQLAELIEAPEALLNFGSIERREDEIMCAIGDYSKFKECVGWEPSKSVKQGIKQLVLAHGKK